MRRVLELMPELDTNIVTSVAFGDPAAKPALTTVAIFCFIGTWNDFMGPLLYLNSPDKFTVSRGLAQFRSVMYTRWDLLMAASTAMTLPIVLIFFAAQRYFVQGVVLTGLKG